jgi:hypothetical protein
MKNDQAELLRALTRRYDASAEALVAVLCPLLIPIRTLDKTILKVPGQAHYRATFTIPINDENWSVVQRGRTGKFVPAGYGGGDPGWKEIAKGRLIHIDHAAGYAEGEIYVGGTKSDLDKALNELTDKDFLEIDQYGAAAKVLSGLAEFYLVNDLLENGYRVQRMPENMARHLGQYANYDFEVSKNGETKRVEVKSIWGTNTKFARLIHSTTTRPKGPESSWTEQQKANYYPTSSCKFATQDIFAVSLFLRTGNIRDFAFARSVPDDIEPHGLPRAKKFPEHVNQNPACEIGDGTWFSSIDEVWKLP